MPTEENLIYQRIGEFVVSFQWLEHKLREIGWFIMDPERKEWPPLALRNLTNQKLIEKVETLFLEALPECNLGDDLESDFRSTFSDCAERLHKLRRDRNRILHSAFIEMKAGGEVQDILMANPKLELDEDTGEPLFDNRFLSPESFAEEMTEAAHVGFALGRCYTQLIARYPHGGA